MFATYLKSGRYLKGWSPKTEIVYQRAFSSFQASLPEPHALPTKAGLESWVGWMRERGLSPSCTNIYIRALNSYCTWLHAEGHLPVHLKLKQIPAPVKPITVFSEQDIRLILLYRPAPLELRTWTLLVFLLDTGCRINEAVSVMNTQIDLDNLLITLDGKGGKYRRVPISIELRKHIFRYTNSKDSHGSLLFCSRNGTKLMYRNVMRDVQKLCKKIGITKRVHLHLTRHTFACCFMRGGGSIYTLSRILGHSTISTTQTYVRGLGVEDFQEEHSRLSPLVRR